MRKRECSSFVIILAGIVLQIVSRKTHIPALNILGWVAFIVGVSRIPIQSESDKSKEEDSSHKTE